MHGDAGMKEKNFIFLEHTADAKFQAFGKNMEEAFANSALAMFSVMTDTEKVRPKLNKTIKAKGNDLKALLYAFLEEFLFLVDTEGFLLHKIKNIKITEKKGVYELSAQAAGDAVSNGYVTNGDVKAVTYNEMEVKQPEGKEKRFIVQVVVDL